MVKVFVFILKNTERTHNCANSTKYAYPLNTYRKHTRSPLITIARVRVIYEKPTPGYGTKSKNGINYDTFNIKVNIQMTFTYLEVGWDVAQIPKHLIPAPVQIGFKN